MTKTGIRAIIFSRGAISWIQFLFRMGGNRRLEDLARQLPYLSSPLKAIVDKQVGIEDIVQEELP